MSAIDARQLAQIAERAMVDWGFGIEPPDPGEIDQKKLAEIPTADGVVDLRSLLWTSIDNPESQDLDQIEAIDEVDGVVRLYVGIADVDWLVKKGSVTDQYAGENTTSVYTGVRTFPMLSPRLSFDLTSLRAHAPRRAIVIETRVGTDGAVLDGRVYPALVENQAKLDYPSISTWLDGGAPPPVLAQAEKLRAQVEAQDRLATLLGRARREAGALDVEPGELRPQLDAQGAVTDLVAHHQDRAGRLIEELMIASNRTVARLLEERGVASIRRVVREPERWARIVAYAAERGTALPAAPDVRSLSRFVDAMRKTRPTEFADISLALIKLMGRGEYVAHAVGASDVGHFGLAIDQYTHSTAPNRRYVDLVTQRLVKAMVGGVASPYSFEDLSSIAAHCTAKESDAQKVERRVHKSLAAGLIAHRIGETFDALVTGASDKGTFVRVSAPAVEGKLVQGGGGLHVGDRVRVRLTAASVERGFIDFAVGPAR